jgi:Leucine-rich repeat (LRR) protein
MLSARDHRRKEDIIETSLCNKGLTTDSPHLRDFLRYLPNLTALDLSFNAMVAIPNLSCGGASIRALNLSNNNICDNTLFSPISLARLSHIIELRMAFNHVTTLAGFKVAVNLQYLDLSHNKIHSLFGIENLKELKCVRLGYNHIDRGLRLFSLMKKLVDIDISHNPVSAKGKLYRYASSPLTL